MSEPTILAETAEYWVINKPAGWAVEPIHDEPSIQGWLIETKRLNPNAWLADERYGVVHRLDTDTSGVLIWARTKSAQDRLKLLWQGRQVEKTYLALVVGECDERGEIELAIARDNANDRMKVLWLNDGRGRAAITLYKRLQTAEFDGQIVSLVEAHPITGRTHQIRVHFKAIGHPIIGDKLYGDKIGSQLAAKLGLNRQFLHAWKIILPSSGLEALTYTAPLPEELTATLIKLNLKFKS